MPQSPATRRAPRLTEATVVGTRRVTPHMVRVTLSVRNLAALELGSSTDHYVKLLFPVPGVVYAEPFDISEIRASLPRHQWPFTRTYTVRRWNETRSELDIDFVIHGDEGLAGPWAVHARPGDTIRFLGPGGGYAPDPAAGHHLLVGDETALPAIAAALERMPEGAVGEALIEIANPDEAQHVLAPSGVAVHWLSRGGARVGAALIDAVRALDLPPGDGIHAFVHGEAGWVKDLRRHLRRERGIPRESLSVSGYWRLGHNEDGWQAAKRDWNAQVEAEQEKENAATSSAA